MNKLKLRKTSHVVSQIDLHIIWCTKFRHPVLVNGADITVKRSIGETCLAYMWRCLAVEIMSDHVHLFIQIAHTDTPCNVAKTLKSISAVNVFHAHKQLKQQKFFGGV
jgi:putative transposase